MHISVSASPSSIPGFERLSLAVWDKVPWSLQVNGAPAPHCSGDGRDKQCLPQGQTAEAYRRRPSPDAERGKRSQEKHGKKRREAEIFPGSAHRVVPFLCTEIPGQEVQAGG